MTIDVHPHGQADGPFVIDDRYRCVDVIGHGRHATVWRAVDQRLGRQVAVKVFRTSSGVHAAGARASVEAMARLVHPNIVRMFDSGRRTEWRTRRSYLVLELVEGYPLALTRNWLSAEEIGRMGLALVGALADIHGYGAVHADIRPRNILVPSSSHGLLASAAKLCDLRMFDTVDIEYSAPEQQHSDMATGASDIYSLGVVLDEFLASCDRRYADLHLVDLFVPDFHAQWEGLRAWMCDADPAARPSAAQVAQALAALLSAQAGETHGDDPAAGAARVRRRRSARPGLVRRTAQFLRPNGAAGAGEIPFGESRVEAYSTTFGRCASASTWKTTKEMSHRYT